MDQTIQNKRRFRFNKPDVNPNDLSCVHVVHRSTMEPIVDVQCVAQALHVLFVTNWYDASVSFVDRMDLARVVVAIFDAYSHRFDFLVMAFELNWMEIVSTTMMILMMTMIHGSYVKWDALIVLTTVTCCAWCSMDFLRRMCDVWMIVVELMSKIPVSNCLDYMIRKKQLRCHYDDHQGLTCYRTMISADLMYVVFVLIQYNLKDYTRHEHTNVFVLKLL